ncbi:subtilase family protein [Thermosporothrix hazakensis]|jgi:subtilisin family serine protease|uniref:Subtilase family protein n=2 Tax=Thermosporothrix hazakensis TaxID=644383 RepID=A0A326UKM5_THEHA|nr:subtilase family protein [Thermosporothrix hazakensis]GCE45788.1 peptidase S8 [Thermosporothrix hazakensis]
MKRYRAAIPILVLAGMLALTFLASLPERVEAVAKTDNYILLYNQQTKIDKNALTKNGNKIIFDLSQAKVMVVRSNNPNELKKVPGVIGLAKDKRSVRLPGNEVKNITTVPQTKAAAAQCASVETSCPLQWDLARINVPQAWKTTQGSKAVRVAVVDTGVNSSHDALGSNYDKASSRSFVQPDADCPQEVDASNPEDQQGHGTWVATHIGGRNGTLMTGIAPNTTLVGIRVLNACGYGYDSWILAGLMYASTINVDIINMSLGGYVCAEGIVPESYYCNNAESVGDSQTVWKTYTQIVKFLMERGTLIIAAAGNDHVRLDREGHVAGPSSVAFAAPMNHPANNLYGLSAVPAGIPGVITVAATNRITAKGGPDETLYGQYGENLKDQLSYYSNFGRRIDVSAPGGSVNYNIPPFDCKSTECSRLRYTSMANADNPGDFGAWGVDANGNPCATCYAFAIGTSMAAPQVAGVAALALAAHPNMTAKELSAWLKKSVTRFLNKNETPSAAEDPASPHYNYDMDYGTPGIPTYEEMGKGVIDAAKAVAAK